MLALIGAGCHRLSEIAGRLQQAGHVAGAASSAVLLEQGLVRRDLPFGAST